MTWHPAHEPRCTGTRGAVELVITARKRDLGGFSVRRVLPAPERRMVGPFIFFDHMGPSEFPPGQGIQVRPHPHIGLSTVTYLFEGEIMHRDSLGYVQPIRAGAVNLMTAGRGIVHSERAGDDLQTHSRLHGIQSWMALPAREEEREPAFEHYPADLLPEFELDGAALRVIIGDAFGHASPVAAYSPMLYLDCRLRAESAISMPRDCAELGVYVVSGNVRIETRELDEGNLAVLDARASIEISSATGAHLMIIGGEPVGDRHIWWNFVSSSRERMEAAKSDWEQGRFDAIPGETEFIPLPRD